MAIKTDAMIAHNGADGYTLHIDYDPDTDLFNLKAIFNDGTVKDVEGSLTGGMQFEQLIKRTLTYVDNENINLVGTFAFRFCNLLVSAILPNVINIGDFAFCDCPELTTVYIPKAERIATYAFTRTPKLTEIYLPASVISMADNIFTQNAAGLVINCGFAADSPAAATAPWGAVGATINYDVPAPEAPVRSALSLTPNPDLIQSIDFGQIEDIQPVEPEPVVEVKKTKRSAK
jgi:hypothetical protein